MNFTCKDIVKEITDPNSYLNKVSEEIRKEELKKQRSEYYFSIFESLYDNSSDEGVVIPEEAFAFFKF